MVLAAGSIAADPAASQDVGDRLATDEFTQGLVGGLTEEGFEVSHGYAQLYTLQNCIDQTYPSLKNCVLANPAAPYVLPVVKSWPDEFVDPAAVDAILDTEPGYSATYRLDPREAIVVYGQMPPPARYMGLQTVVFSQQGPWDPEAYDQWASMTDPTFPVQYLFSTLPPDDPTSQRILSFTSVGDIVNSVVMERASGYPFGEIRYFIITANAATERAVRLALQAQGVPDSHIFTERIPSEDELGPVGPLGMDEDAIDFVTTMRFAVPEDPAAAQAWRAALPLTVLRVRGSTGPVELYPTLAYEARAGNSEADLAEDVQDLVVAVCDGVSRQAGLTSTDCLQPPPASASMLEMTRDLDWVGPSCRDAGMDCNVDQNDMAFYLSSSPLPLDAGQVIAVVGTLATETGNATYVGLSANDASVMAGVANALDSDVTDAEGNLLIKGLRGSADAYQDTVDNSDKLFVHYFTQDCAALEGVPGGVESCSATTGVEPAIGDPTLRGKFIIALRNYIAAGTQRGADPDRLVTPMILTFTP
jgi:hypothetical protein